MCEGGLIAVCASYLFLCCSHETIRRQQEQQATAECTFTPRTNRAKNNAILFRQELKAGGNDHQSAASSAGFFTARGDSSPSRRPVSARKGIPRASPPRGFDRVDDADAAGAAGRPGQGSLGRQQILSRPATPAGLTGTNETTEEETSAGASKERMEENAQQQIGSRVSRHGPSGLDAGVKDKDSEGDHTVKAGRRLYEDALRTLQKQRSAAVQAVQASPLR